MLSFFYSSYCLFSNCSILYLSAVPSGCGREHSCDGGKLVTGQSSRGRLLLDLEHFQLLLRVLGHQGGYKLVLM